MMDSRYFFMDVILSSLRGWFQPFFGVWVEIVEIWVRDVPVGANMIRPLVYHSSGTSCHLLYKRRLSQIVSSLEEMPGRAEKSARANMIRPLVCHSSGTSCHLLYKRRLSQIVSSLEEMP
ncbi:hypothetical protein, partial [Ruminococcus sp.]|uniref:hypothetical protein n=1 Tax=Ruminococcus sp. TaxID=41978 RepID=UPI0030799C32